MVSGVFFSTGFYFLNFTVFKSDVLLQSSKFTLMLASFDGNLCITQTPPGESNQDETTPKQEVPHEETSSGENHQQEETVAEAGDVREELFMAAMEYVPEYGWSKKAIAAG